MDEIVSGETPGVKSRCGLGDRRVASALRTRRVRAHRPERALAPSSDGSPGRRSLAHAVCKRWSRAV